MDCWKSFEIIKLLLEINLNRWSLSSVDCTVLRSTITGKTSLSEHSSSRFFKANVTLIVSLEGSPSYSEM